MLQRLGTAQGWIFKKKLRVKWITGETSQKYSPGFPLDLPGKKSMTRAYLNSVDDFAAAGYERERVFLANNPICWMYDETMHLPQKYVDVGIGVFSCWWLVCLWWTNHANGAMQHQTNILKHMGTQKHKHKHRHRNKPTLTHTHTKNIKKHSFRHDFFSKFLISRVGEVTLHFKRITLPSQQGQTKILVNYICCSNFAKIIFCRRYVFILSFCIPFTLMFSGWYFKHAGFPLHQPWVCFDPMDSKF